MPTRIWEFFLGYVAAKYFNNEGQTNLSIPAMGLLGLVIILCIPLMPVDEHSTSIVFGHPGLWALFVCSATVLILAIVIFGAFLPLLKRVLVPAGYQSGPGAMASDAEDDEDDKIEVQEGESLEDIKAKLKPKKAAISAEMLDTANTYDDKVAVIRMIVGDEAGRVSSVFKNMMEKE